MTAAVVAPAGQQREGTREFMPVLEGLRGFLSMFVAAAHVFERYVILRTGSLTHLPPHFVAVLHGAVGAFIVVSGYVLGLPVARAGQRFRDGWRAYAVRRARRILPAYYVAFALSLTLVTFTAPILGEQLSPHRLALSTVLHLLMLHNFSNSAISTIDGPMWSVAAECDIYVLFALLLVPTARRFGFAAMIAGAVALSIIPTLLGALHHDYLDYRLAQTCPWYLALFAFGYAAAAISADDDSPVARRFGHWPWGPIAAALALATVAAIALTPATFDFAKGGNGIRWYADLLLGAAFAAQFIADARARRLGRRTVFERIFTLRPLLISGTFSYSFYLVHIPVSDAVASFVRPGWSDAQAAALSIPAYAAAVVVAYGCYLLAERPFMSAYRRAGDAATLRSPDVVAIVDAGDSRVQPVPLAAADAGAKP